MRWVLLIVALLACTTICWSKGKPTSVARNRNYPDRDEQEECGRIKIQIKRNSGPFRRLINHPSRSKRVRSDSADHFYVSNRLKLIIDRLIILLASDDVIFIIRGWSDVIIQSERLALRYEGRSIRFRYGSNNIASRLRALAGLAIEAGCDWVRNDDDENITCSVKPDDCRVPTDLAFMLDTSGSVGRKNHKEALNFIFDVVNYFNIGSNATQVALIPFGTYVHSYFFFNSFTDKATLLRKILSTRYSGGWTRTWKAMYVGRRYVYNITTNLGVRPISSGVPRIVVILTDGKSNGRDAIPYVNRLKDEGVIIFSVGIGGSIDQDELNEFASDPVADHVLLIDSYTDIEDFVNRLSTYTCTEPGVTDPGNNTEVELPEDDFRYFQGMCTSYNQSNNTITIEETDVEGSCFVYVSTDPNNRNPGPLTDSLSTYSNTSNTVVKHITLPSGINTTLVYISLRGTGTMNRCTVTIYDSLFNQTEYTFSLPEAVYNNRTLGTLLAEFRSGGFEYRYSIIPERDYNFFDIDSYSGLLTVSGSFNREERSEYRASVLVEDPRIACLKGRTTVFLVISDVNDNPPIFVLQSYTASVLETASINYSVITVSANDSDLGTNADVTYSFGNTPAPSTDFSITSDGVVSVSASLDGFTTPSYQYTVVATDGGQPPMTGTATLNIIVEQVNFPPAFTVCLSGTCELSLSEDAAPGDVGLVLNASDPDTGGPDAELTYSGGSSPFEIDSATGAVRLTAALDRETVSRYTLEFIVSDGGIPSLDDTVSVVVTVTDVNDNPPVFVPQSYSEVLAENVGSTVIFQVSTTDLDEGPNAEILYSLSGDYSQFFSIDTNGIVSTRAAFDFESIPSNPLQFLITATDPHGVFSVNALGSLRITDVNDNSPVISGDIATTLSENTPIDTVVFNLTVSDADSGNNGEISVALVDGNQDGLFLLTYTDTFAIIRLRLNLDFETSLSHTLKFRATDGGDPARITSLDLTVSVGDINDNSPVCINGINNTLREDVPIGTQVGQVSASDGDRPNTPNSQIFYSVTAVNNSQELLYLFSVSNVGVVTTNGTLDIEASPQYIISVTASDNGVPSQSCVSLITLTLQDVNEFPPVINTTASALNVSVREDTPVGTLIAAVSATDQDFTGQITYGLSSNDFSINSTTGDIYVKMPLDFETTPFYQLTVIASDESTEQTAILYVRVININDITPTTNIVSPVEVSEATPVGSVVLCFEISDGDGDANGEFSVVLSGSGAALLNYNSSTSCLILAHELDREGDLGDNIWVILTVNDNGEPNLHSTIEFQLVILDANDNPPLFPTGPLLASVPENTAVGTPVRSVIATDRDEGLNSEIRYSLNSTQFAIGSVNGEITVNGSIDFESTPVIVLQVTARDLGDPSLTATVIVIVSVTDVNDNVPQITNLPNTMNYEENGDLNSAIFEVMSSDLDTDPNSVNRQYSIISITPNNIPSFSINQTTGLITVDANQFNREAVPSYTLTVSVSDGLNSDSKDLTVVITDVNDNAPVLFGGLSFSIRECEDNCYNISIVQTTDNDQAGNNSSLSSVTVFNTNSFTASLQSTHAIYISCIPNTLDFERTDTESFVLQATDGGSPPLSTNVTIKVNVTDCNDNNPMLSPAVIEISLSEDTQVSTVVANFSATDIDTGPAGVITYRQAELDLNFFAIDATTGEVTLIRALDFETDVFHYFNISASDGGSPSLTSEGLLKVTVVNVNDNFPVFDPVYYVLDLPEDTALGYVYTQLQATDADGDSIVFSVEAGSPFMVYLNSSNLTLVIELDFETQRTYYFSVYASNPGSTQSVSATVMLNVLDVNDNPPTFTNVGNTFSIAEDTQTGTFVFDATAQDLDSGVNGMFSFFFHADLDDFNISSSGSVTTARTLDREATSLYTLTIIVQDMGNPALSSTMNFTVQITDFNDNTPVFVLSPYSDSIFENATLGTLLNSVIIATDADLGENGVVDLTDNSAEFNVLSNGSVSLAINLDFELRRNYIFTVIATDGGTPALSNTTQVTVQVLNVNDNSPIFSPNEFQQTLQECNQLTHTCLCQGVIFTAVATDADNDMLTYSLQVITGADIFSINSTTGSLTAACEVDREVNDMFQIRIFASDGLFTAYANLSLTISDVNDNIPYFTDPNMVRQVREDTQLNTEIAVIVVIDRDIGMNGAVELSIQLVHPPNIPTVLAISQDGHISLSRALDFEAVREYQFQINATDRGSPRNRNTTTFTLQVTDFNDNPPIFDRSNYSVYIAENSPPQAVLCVSASDADSGANAQLTYFVLNSTQLPDELEPGFSFDGCNLSTVISFDFEEIESFTIFIGVRDAGPPSLSTTVPVFVQILNLNDNVPMFVGEYPNPLLVSENTPVGNTILTVRATDDDSGVNGEVSFSLSQGSNVDATFNITADGVLRTRAELDFESIQTYSFLVNATDSGSPPRSSSLNITVQVVNENDNTPVFSQNPYMFSIPENSGSVKLVGATPATDADIGLFGMLTYSIASDPNNILTYLDATSHNLTAITLDRETRSSYSLSVLVQDGGTPPLSDTAVVSITVLDVNDNTPTFDNDSVEVMIRENVPLGTLVAELHATDRDEPNTLNSMISFSTNDTRLILQTDSATGAVTILTNSSIDRETQSLYVILITATDNGDPPLSSSAYVTVVVLDVDDNSPVFTETFANITLSEDTSTGTVVATFNVLDADSSSQINYTIQPNDTFSVNSSGAVLLSSALDFETIRSYNLTVTATDNTNMPVLATLLVFVTDVNEFSPSFQQNYTASVSENRPQGTSVVTVVASDSDSGQQLLYAISGNRANEFQIGPTSGVVTTQVSLDREDPRGYVISLLLHVTDSGTPALMGFASLTISVLDENDNSPQFINSPPATLTLPEDTPVLSNIAQTLATDADTGTNAEITYSIQGSSPFNITQTGQIQLASPLDFESESEYTVVVIATDGGVNPRSTNATIVVTVTDVNDNAPTFLNTPYKASVEEHAVPSTSLFAAVASDLDSGNNSQLVFSLSANPYLSINQSSGTIVVVGNIDRELVGTINVTITVCDRGLPSLCDSELLCVTVIDINDQHPTFETQQSKLILPEGPAPPNSVFQAIATDNDEPNTVNSRIVSYTISPASSNFTVNNQGQVFAPDLDFETIIFYQLTITATDGGNPPLSGSRVLTVEVTDINDNPPIITISPGEIEVPEDQTPSQLNVTITATDRDSGANGEVTFLLQESDSPFTLSPTGVLFLSGTLDFDTDPQSYNLTIVASDSGNPSMSSTGTLVIRVGEVNDNSPIFNQSSYEASIREGLVPTFPVLGVSASDADFNSQVSYSIFGPSPFSIDSSGRISGEVEIDFEQVQSFGFHVIATDSGTPQRSTEVPVIVNIIDINDNAPQIETDVREINVSESSDHPRLLLSLSAVDSDSGQNGEIFFTLDSSNQIFFIIDNFNTGALHLNASLDFETVQFYTLLITAHDRGDPELNTTITVVVNVVNENDNAPVFDPAEYSPSVREDRQPDYLVITVQAGDLDLGVFGMIDYSLSNNNFFSINEQGYIFLVSAVDAESLTSIELSVTACDRGSPARCATAPVSVSILDVNDNSPQITSPSNGDDILISESSTAETIVTAVVAIDSDRTAPNNLVSYEITTASNDGVDFFAINSLTGLIHLTNSLDFEDTLKRQFNLTVTVSDQGSPSLNRTVSFQIRVTDANDNHPVLTNGPLTVSIQENLSAQPGPQFSATDADTGINARIIFSISEPSIVSINQDTGMVTLNGPFDFEDTDVYNFTVTATDQGSPSLSDTTFLIVQILDTNDNTPLFSMDLYVETIPESTSVNQTILSVSATDADGTANNNVISYSISPSSQSNFLVNSNGDISLTQMLDFESLPSQTTQFSVVATDNGSPALSSTSIVRITVTDSNDNSPQIGALAGVSILEGSAMQTVLITVQATDADSGLNAVLNYSIANSNSVPFSINSEGTILVTGALDRETQDSYTLIVLVQDNGSPSLSSQVTLNVNISDRNDNPPTFLSLPYAFQIPENVSIYTSLGQIEVTDRDIGVNANLTCSLSGIGSDNFALSSNGVIHTVAPLDRETVAFYSLTVTCRDTSTSPLISTETLNISVTDINDNSPQFPNQQYVFEIREDANPDTNVGQLQASDLDDPATPNAQIEFSITAGNVGYYFSITPNGLLRTNNTSGRIPVTNFTLTVTATDGGTPSLSNSIDVLIRVIDVNDVAPSFNTSDVPIVRISEYTPVGDNVANFTATDLEGSVVTYFLRTDSGTAGDFRVDSGTGGIFVNMSLDFERDQSYTIVIIAVDNPPMGSGPARTGIVTIPIFITDENDNSPIFDPDSYQVSINESVHGPLTLVTVSATDRDSDANGVISYSLSPPSALAGLFSINSETGVVSLVSGVSFDFEGSLGNQFDLQVTATDNGTPPNQDTASLTVSIIDVNDHSPQIPAAYTAVITEGAPSGTFLIRVQATDLDTGINGEIVYSLGQSVPFEINSVTGDISSTLVLDRENISAYSFVVTATDRGDPSRSNSTVVTVEVQDVNDNCPTVTNSDTGQTIIEGISGEVLQINIQVVDLDSGLNGEFNYSIPDPALMQIFSIVSSTGQLVLLQTLDREAISQYNLTVLITDRGVPSCTATTFVIIDVLDQNDNRATFIGTPYEASINEGVPLDTLVICVNASDPDEGVNAQFTLELLGTVPFALDATTGCIRTAGEMDRETNPQFSLTVRAVEQSDNSLFSTATVLVILIDRNDVTPHFTMDPYTFNVNDPETTAPIGVLVALDEDEGLNGQLTYNYSLSDDTNTQVTYVFSVSDMGMPTLSSSTSVIINFPNCESLEISTTNTNNEVSIVISTLCSATVELVSTFTVINSSVTLNCNVVGNILFTVQWFRDGDPLQAPSSDTRLTIQSLTEEDEGDYTCKVTSTQLTTTSEPYRLTVQIPPEITIPPRNLAINAGDTLNLTCYSTGVPDPEHQWSLISDTLENGFVVLPSQDAPGFAVTKNQITLPDFSVEYVGSYSCNASNVVGYDEARGDVIIHAPSDVVTIGIPTNFSNPDPNNNGCNNLDSLLLDDLFGSLTGTLSSVTSISGDSNLCDPNGGTTTTTTTTTMCSPNPCNGYACTLDLISGFFCECPPTLDGQTCNLDMNECSQPGFCQNGGMCVNVFDGFTCNCLAGYSGETCEIPISCNETSCPDGQMCVDTVDSFNCLTTQNVTVNTTSEQAAENVANTAGSEEMSSSVNRRRRQTGAPPEAAYRNCTVLTYREPGSTVVILIIGCLGGFTLSESDYSEVCQFLYDSYANFRTCSTPAGNVTPGPKTPPTPRVAISIILRDPVTREVIPGDTAVSLISTSISDASSNSTFIRQLIDLGFSEPNPTQISVTSPPLPVIPPNYTTAIIITLLILLILVITVFCCVLLCVCLRRRSKEDKVTSYENSVHEQPASKPVDLELGVSTEMRDVSAEQPDNDYGIVEQAVAVTTFSNPNAVESEEPVQAPAKQSLASKFSFKKDNTLKEDKESLVPTDPTGTTEATNLASYKTDSSKKPELGKADSLPRRILAATTSFGKKKEHSGIEATPLIDENSGSRESLSDAVPEPLPEKLPPKKKFIEPQGPTVNERELVAGALVPIAERDREYNGDQADLYSNVDVKADATMAQLWETAVKEKQEKKQIAGKKLISVQSPEDIQSGAANTDQSPQTTESTAIPTESTAKPTESTAKPTESTAKPTESTAIPTESTAKPTESTAKPTESTAKPTESTTIPTESVAPEASQPVPKPTSPTKKPLIEKVEQTLSYPWYHSDLDREGAEVKLMQLAKEGGFLVRAASSSKGDYSLSVLVSYKEPLIKHLLIRDNGSELVLQSSGAKDTFPHLAALVAYYSKEVFVFSDWQKSINLLYPVLNQ